MTQEEKNELMERLGPQDYEAYMELRRQMDVLAADERMDDAQKAAFYAQIREELIVMRRQRDLLTRRLQAFNDLIDEVETRLKETEKYDRRKKKKLRLLPPPPTNAQIDYRERQEAHFAQGMTFYKLFWVFFIGCFAGVVLETIYCLIQRGHYESRVGLIYGPFNLVYGIGKHVCPGRLLATLQMRILLRELLVATASITLDAQQPAERAISPVGGWAKLPVVLG